MTTSFRDRLLCTILFLVGVGWAIASETTISSGYSGSLISPRSFPTLLGIALAVLAVIALVESEVRRTRQRVEPTEVEMDKAGLDAEVWSACATFGFLVTYFIALQVLGFTLATIISVAAFLWLVLGQRSLLAIGGMSLGLGFGLYLLMGRVLGVFLPTGMLGLGI